MKSRNSFAAVFAARLRRGGVHRGMSAFMIEKGASGLTVSRDIDKLGYKSGGTNELQRLIIARNLLKKYKT
jgi:alkylation response protein AidB-like acyl-CoA dehydrogenase